MKSNLDKYALTLIGSQLIIILLLILGLIQISQVSIPQLPACMAVDSSGRCLGAGDIVIP